MRPLRRSLALVVLVTACASGTDPSADPPGDPSGDAGTAGTAGTKATGGRAGAAGAGGKGAAGKAGSLSTEGGQAGAAGVGGASSGAAGQAGAAGTTGQGGGLAGASGGVAAGAGGQGGKPADLCGKFVAECPCGQLRGACVEGMCDCTKASAPREDDNVSTCEEAKKAYPSPSWDAVKGTCDAGRVCLAMPPDKAKDGSGEWGDRFCRLPPNPAQTLGGIDEGPNKKIYQYCCLPPLGSTGGMGGGGGATSGNGGASGSAGKAGAGGASAGTGGTSAGNGGSSAGTGGSDAGAAGTSAGSAGTNAGSGGSDAGSGGTSAGSGGTSAGNGGTSAGAGGKAGSAGTGGKAGSAGSSSGCTVSTPPAECACVTARSSTGRGVQQCLPGASAPTCDCRNAKPVSAGTSAPLCRNVTGTPASFRFSCVNDTEFTDCRVVETAGTWVPSYCATPLGGATNVDVNGTTRDVRCCKPVDGKPEPICDLPAEDFCYSSADPRTFGVIGDWICDPVDASPTCKLTYAQPFPAQNDIRTCANATGLSPAVNPNLCAGEPLFTRCLVTASSQEWAGTSCAYINGDHKAADGTFYASYCCLPPKP